MDQSHSSIITKAKFSAKIIFERMSLCYYHFVFIYSCDVSGMPPNKYEIDHSGGRAFISEGVIFYSPNSTRQVMVPARRDNSYRFHKRDAYLNRFQTPEWWTLPYGYLCCVPLLPSFNGAAFGCLRDILSTVEGTVYSTHEEYFMSSRKTTEWLNLETSLIQIAFLLRQKFLVGAALNPIPPSLLGFRERFRTRRYALSRFTASRDWFVIWMSLLSFTIAQIEFTALKHDIPGWFSYLVDENISQVWLNGIHQSGICNFSQSSLRVGVFINWLEKDDSRPRLEFFCRMNIPVWYPWTTELGKLVASYPVLANLQPPPEQLQLATTFIMQQPSTFPQFVGVSLPPTSDPSPVHSPPRDMSFRELLAARLSHVKTRPWSAFFEARDVRNKEKAAKETSEAREARLNRERKPPQNKVEVYIWDWSEEDPLQLVRTRVTTNKERKDALGSFSSSQSVYNSWSNEWDLCEYFGPSDDDEDEDSLDGFEEHNDPDSRDNEIAHAAYIVSCIQGPAPFPSHDSLTAVDAADPSPVNISFDLLDYLSTHYGFVYPLSHQKISVDNEAWDNCMKALGRFAGPHNPPLLDFPESIIHFIKALQSPSGPNSDEFDCFPDNRITIKTSRLFRDIVRIEKFFVVQPHAFEPNSFPWSIALYDVPQALYVFRLLLKNSHTSAALAHILLEEGVAFRTVQPLRDVYSRSSLDDIVTIVPIRLSDYIFKASDYDVYVHHHAMILSSPRGRAALLRGGIVGRLAREHLAIDSACLGPSSSVTVHRVGFNIVDGDGMKYWDDELTDDEIDVICGLHRCYTGM